MFYSYQVHNEIAILSTVHFFLWLTGSDSQQKNIFLNVLGTFWCTCIQFMYVLIGTCWYFDLPMMICFASLANPHTLTCTFRIFNKSCSMYSSKSPLTHQHV